MGFKTNGDVSTPQDISSQVVFCLKSSAGKELKTYTIPRSEADEFEAGIRAEEPSLREAAGEKDPLVLVRISRCF